MRKAVDDCGLSHLVPGTGEEAMERMVRALESHQEGEKSSIVDFDPLSVMMWNFSSRVMERIGLSIMQSRSERDGMPENMDEAGFNHVCPLCVVKRDFDAHNTATGRCGNPECPIRMKTGEVAWDEQWLTSCADSMLQYAGEQGLVRKQ